MDDSGPRHLKIENTSRFGDIAAICLSNVCIIHCLALPVLTVMIPSSLSTVLEEEVFHLYMRYTACTHIACDHEHLFSQFLICVKCQVVTEINISELTMRNMRDNAESAGFELESPQLEINGVCYICKNKAA